MSSVLDILKATTHRHYRVTSMENAERLDLGDGWRKIAITPTTIGQTAKPFSSEEYLTLYWKEVGISVASAFGPDLL
jgi:hypothetical protein